jgi:predicted CXXCH cytochrome family protein
VAGLVLAACTTTDIVYRERPPFNTPPDETSGFLGYYTVATRQTTCGNCHVGHQANWVQTLHARANQTLAENSHATATCYACHSLDEKGNKATGPAGWTKVNDSAYKDVQCESCHGPGLEHAKLPDNRANWPLARLTLYDSAASCAACHTGTRHGFVQGWEQSGHAKLESPAVNNTTSTCRNCHEGKTALKAWGVNTNYQERDSASVNSQHVCAVCHDPHGSGNDHQLRFPINTPDPDQNLCMKCHLNRGNPTTSNSTPHGSQGYVLLGIAGYRPAGVSIDTQVVLTTHSSEANPKLCAGCHVNAFDVTDPTTGSFVFHSTGHDFHPLPCVDATGNLTGETDCAYNTTERNYTTCAKSGCHANVNVAASLLSTLRNDIKNMADQIWVDGNGDNKIQAPPTDGGYLAIIQRDRPTELSTTTVLTPARGAQFNVLLFADRKYGHGDNSFGVHNPFLARALLAANITELRAAYGLAAPPPSVQAEMDKALSDAKVRSPNFIRSPLK